MSEREAGVTLPKLLEVTGGTLRGAPPTERFTHLLHPRDARYEALRESAVVVMSTAAAPELPPALLVAAATQQPPEPGRAPALLLVPDARLALARLTRLFAPPPAPGWGEAAVHGGARIGAHVQLAPGAVIGNGALLGARTRVGAGSVIGDGVVLGEECVIHPNVTLYPGTRLGDRVTVHAGAVIGADGFGYAAGAAGPEKIYHLGGVEIGSDAEIGASTTIDRGTLLATRVGAHTKIDNQCQIGHNVSIGAGTLIAGMCGVAGSATIGNGVILGGFVAVSDHVKIGDGARIAGRSGVTKDVPAGATWAGFPARPHREFVRELYLLGRLERIWRAVKGTGVEGE